MYERPIQIDFARRMRRDPTPSENALWQMLRRSQLDGHEFRRQHPIPNTRFIADFYCKALKMIIEVDGGYHTEPEQAERDEVRQMLITELGYTFARFTDEEVTHTMPYVLKTIEDTARHLSGARPVPPLSPSPFPPADGEKGEPEGVACSVLSPVSDSPFSPSAGGKGLGDRGATGNAGAKARL